MIETIYQRRSIRKFTNEKISDENILTLLKCAMAAPSARNTKPWEFYVIKDETTQQSLRDVSKNFAFNSSLIIIVAGNTDKSMTKNDNDFWIQDCSAAIENILLAATSLGIGSVWCGIYPVKERVEAVRKIIKEKENIILQIGYKVEKKLNFCYNRCIFITQGEY